MVDVIQTKSLYEPNNKSNKVASQQESDVFEFSVVTGVWRLLEVPVGASAFADHFIHA